MVNCFRSLLYMFWDDDPIYYYATSTNYKDISYEEVHKQDRIAQIKRIEWLIDEAWERNRGGL